MGQGNLPGMGFLQMLTNGMGGGGGGGAPGAPPPGAAGPGAGAPPPSGPQPGAKALPGYAEPLSLFGNMTDSDLTQWMAANGVRQPQGK